MNRKIKAFSAKYYDKPVLITGQKNIYYLTGSEIDGLWILLYKYRIFVITSKMTEAEAKRYFSSKADIITVSVSLSKSLADFCKLKKIKEIYIETSDLSFSIFDAVEKNMQTKAISVNKIDSLTDLRKIKDNDEIKNIKKACDIVSCVYKKIKQEIKPGITESDVFFKIEREFAKNHVISSFKTIIASGPNSANPHHKSTNRKILNNDIVLIDMGCVYKGYCSDLTRIVFLGKINRVYNKIWTVVKQAHDASLSGVKAGVMCSGVDFAAREVIKKAGFGNNFIHSTGHGVGLDIHESPAVSQTSKEVLQKDTVITIEPGIYIEGKFGIRIEDTVLVTKNGYKILTNTEY